MSCIKGVLQGAVDVKVSTANQSADVLDNIIAYAYKQIHARLQHLPTDHLAIPELGQVIVQYSTAHATVGVSERAVILRFLHEEIGIDIFTLRKVKKWPQPSNCLILLGKTTSNTSSQVLGKEARYVFVLKFQNEDACNKLYNLIRGTATRLGYQRKFSNEGVNPEISTLSQPNVGPTHHVYENDIIIRQNRNNDVIDQVEKESDAAPCSDQQDDEYLRMGNRSSTITNSSKKELGHDDGYLKMGDRSSTITNSPNKELGHDDGYLKMGNRSSTITNSMNKELGHDNGYLKMGSCSSKTATSPNKEFGHDDGYLKMGNRSSTITNSSNKELGHDSGYLNMGDSSSKITNSHNNEYNDGYMKMDNVEDPISTEDKTTYNQETIEFYRLSEKDYINKLDKCIRKLKNMNKDKLVDSLYSVKSLHLNYIFPVLTDTMTQHDLCKCIISNDCRFAKYETFIRKHIEADVMKEWNSIGLYPQSHVKQYIKLLEQNNPSDDTQKAIAICNKVVDFITSMEVFDKLFESPLPHEYLGTIKAQSYMTVKDKHDVRSLMVLLQESVLTLLQMKHDYFAYENHILLKEVIEIEVFTSYWILKARGRGRENMKQYIFTPQNQAEMKNWIYNLQECSEEFTCIKLSMKP